MSVSANTTSAAFALTPRAKTISLCVVLLAFFMDLLDATIVNVAIPSIQRGIGASYSAIQWVIAGYSLAFALCLITGGRLGDIFGYRRLFLFGIAGFTVASAICGLASSTDALIAARLLQGLMAALMVPQILSIIQVIYTTTDERRGISAYYGALAGIATVAGPIVGALLIAGNPWGMGWRTIFLVNLPVGVAAVVLAAIYLPDAKSPHPLRIDVVGIVVVVVAMLLLMYPLIQGRELGWPPWTIVSIALSLPVFFLFALSQMRKDKRDGSPLVVPRLFQQRSFVAGIVLLGAFFAVISGFLMSLTIFLQVGLRYDILRAGLTGIPFSLGVSVASGISNPVLLPRFGRSIITAGPLIMAAGLVMIMATIRHFGAVVTPWEMIPALVTSGIGMGLVVASVYPFILAEVHPKDAGSASGVINAVGQVGGAVGIALFGVVFFGLISRGVGASLVDVRSDLQADIAAAGAPPSTRALIVDGFERCFHDRVAGKGDSSLSSRCAEGEESPLAKSDAIAVVIDKYAMRANQKNFQNAMIRTLVWLSVVLAAISCVTLLLPAQPGSQAQR